MIVVEDPNIAGMGRNHNLAQKILDASLGKFLQMLSYKAGGAGRRLVKVDPRGTSRDLPEGSDRDYVASLRILRVGLGRPKLMPAEVEPLRELVQVPASSVVEAGSSCPFGGG